MNAFEQEENNNMGITWVWQQIAYQEHLVNPFQILLNWCRVEILDLEAMAESIDYLNKLSDVKDRISPQLLKADQELENAKKGKKSWKSLFGKKQTEE